MNPGAEPWTQVPPQGGRGINRERLNGENICKKYFERILGITSLF